MEKRGNLHKRSGKRTRDSGLRILKRLIKGPIYPRDLRKELGVSRNTVSYHLRKFITCKIAKKLKDKRYALINYVDGEEAVIKSINQWRTLAFRYPTVQEIANETGIVPDEAEPLAYKTKDKTGWSIPNEAAIEVAREKLGEILVCAARIRQGAPEAEDLDYRYQDDPQTRVEAERFLKKHPQMLPKLGPENWDIASWSSEALKYLGKWYKPKDRPRRPAFIFT